jgi:hypothetical protein
LVVLKYGGPTEGHGVMWSPSWFDPQDTDRLRDVLVRTERGQATSQANRVSAKADRLRYATKIELGIELVIVRRQQNEDQRRVGQMLREWSEPAQAALHRAISDRQESPRLPVPCRSSPSGDFENSFDLLAGQPLAREMAD